MVEKVYYSLYRLLIDIVYYSQYKLSIISKDCKCFFSRPRGYNFKIP